MSLSETAFRSSPVRCVFRQVDPPPTARKATGTPENLPRLALCAELLRELSEFCTVIDVSVAIEQRERIRQIEAQANAVLPDDDSDRDQLPQLQQAASPRVLRLSMSSPLVVDIVTSVAGTGGISVGAAYLLKNPEALGSWIPRVRASWYQAQAEAETARRLHAKLIAAGMEVEELED
jgi:hypothetical protein